MKATGNTRKIMKKVNQIQLLIGLALEMHYDDKNPHGFQIAQEKLKEAFDLCIEIRDMYDPI